MDQERLINLWNEYQEKRDTYTPEQQEAMDAKFWTLANAAKEFNSKQEDEVKEEVKESNNIKPWIHRYKKKELKTEVDRIVL